jgi:hyperosmotically inducible periplasmic protein
MRAIRAILLLLVLAVVGVFAYNYWSGYGWTLRPPATSGGVDAERVREKGAELAEKGAAAAKVVAEQTEQAMSNAALTAKIKSKMALDDYVKARTVDVDTNGSIVTVTGTVQSEMERERVVRLARETAGVEKVIDRLQVVK